MKKLYNYLFLMILYMHQSTIDSSAITIAITNLTGAQASVTVQTSTEQITQIIPANINPLLNDINEPAPSPTTISFAHNPITKIVITRFAPNMPQIIYYDGESTVDNQSLPGGIYNLELTSTGKMLIWKDYIELNNVAYSLTDLQSYVLKCNKLQTALSSSNLDATQKQLDDLLASIKAVRESDMGSQVAIQLSAIQTTIDTIANNIKTIKILDENLQMVEDLQNQMSLGNNNLTGTNKPYQPADDSIERTQKTVQMLESGLQNISQSNTTGIIAEKTQKLHAALATAQELIDTMKVSQMAANHEIMISPTNNLQTFQNS